jgi:hypothetical protein
MAWNELGLGRSEVCYVPKTSPAALNLSCPLCAICGHRSGYFIRPLVQLGSRCFGRASSMTLAFERARGKNCIENAVNAFAVVRQRQRDGRDLNAISFPFLVI